MNESEQSALPAQVHEHPLGLHQGLVRLAHPHASWLDSGSRERLKIQALLGKLAIDVQHVGSTSVPGLDAKPILDIAVALDPLARSQVKEIAARMQAGGYQYRGDHGPDGGLMFVRGAGDVRTVHVHMVPGDDPEWTAYIRFRDHLRANPRRRDEYQQLKRQLAARYPDDRAAYTDAKARFVAETLRLVDDQS